MEIFKIVRKDQGDVTEIHKSEPEKTPYTPSDESASESEDLKKAKVMAGEVPSATSNDKEAKEPGEEMRFSLDDEAKQKNVVVKIDGPLSHVFTQSLNKILAFENMVMMPAMVDTGILGEPVDYNDTVTINVYAYDASDMSTDDLVDINRSVSYSNKEDHIIAMESASGISKTAVALDKLAKQRKYTVPHFRIDSAAEHALRLIKKIGA